MSKWSWERFYEFRYYVHLEIDPNGFGCVVGAYQLAHAPSQACNNSDWLVLCGAMCNGPAGTNNHTKALEEEGGPTEEELRGESPPVPVDLTALLKTMGTLTKQPIESFSASFQYHLPQRTLGEPDSELTEIACHDVVPMGNVWQTATYLLLLLYVEQIPSTDYGGRQQDAASHGRERCCERNLRAWRFAL